MADAARDRFLAIARDLGVEPDIRTFPDGTRTAADAAAAVGCDVEAIVKSLLFVADDDPVLALTSGTHRVDEARLAAHLGATTVRKATADEVREVTGFAIGGTHPFAARTAGIRCLVDPHLLALDEVWAAAGTPMDVWPLDPALLVDVAGAEAVDVTA